MKSYVLGLAFSQHYTEVALIRKNRPDWQKGKLNGPGGLVDPSEDVHSAMCREFFEETTVESEPKDWSHFLRIHKLESHYVYCLASNKIDIRKVQTVTDEVVGIYDVDQLLASLSSGTPCDIPMVENLMWMTLLAIDHLTDRRPHAVIAEYEPQ